jgi:uncharacterized membrane protein YgcG
MEKARPLPQENEANVDLAAVRYVTRLHRKADRGEHQVVAFAMARYSSISGSPIVSHRDDSDDGGSDDCGGDSDGGGGGDADR